MTEELPPVKNRWPYVGALAFVGVGMWAAADFSDDGAAMLAGYVIGALLGWGAGRIAEREG